MAHGQRRQYQRAAWRRLRDGNQRRAAGRMFGYGQTYLLAGVSQRLVASIRQKFYSHIQRLSQSFHDQRSLGDLLTRLSGDVGMMRELMVLSFMAIVERVVILVGMVTVMALIDWRLTLVAVVVLSPLSLLIRRYGREIKGASRKQRRRESTITSTFNERISAIRLVQAYARAAHEEERLAQRNSKDLKVGMLAARLEAQLERLVQASLAFGTCGVRWYRVILVQAGAITPGDLIVFTAYLTAPYKPIRKIASITSRLSKATAAGELIVAILDIEPEIRDAPGAIAAPPLRDEIELENVSFACQPGCPVLTDASFRLAVGETVALTGDSGAGKSSMASFLLRFYDPDRGCVRIDGSDIRDFTLVSLREQISVVLQEPVLFNATIRDNIAYGKLDATDEEIVAAARAANADGFIAQLGDGYDIVVGKRGSTLSGGQRQRIAIARAMIRNAAIVILDEPLAGLHKEAADAVRDALANLTAGKTCLLITHDPAAAAKADSVYALRGKHHR